MAQVRCVYQFHHPGNTAGDYIIASHFAGSVSPLSTAWHGAGHRSLLRRSLVRDALTIEACFEAAKGEAGLADWITAWLMPDLTLAMPARACPAELSARAIGLPRLRCGFFIKVSADILFFK